MLSSSCGSSPKNSADSVLQPEKPKQKRVEVHKPQVVNKTVDEKTIDDVALPLPPLQQPVELQQDTKKTKAEKPVITKSLPIHIKRDSLHQKKTFEFVVIAGEKYPVPAQWRGKKLDAQPLPLSSLQQIPEQFTFEASKLYMLKEVKAAFIQMASQAKKENIQLLVHSAYRSAWYQGKMIRDMMAKGRTWEDLIRYVAPPGYSEHMLGTVVDLYPSNWSFASTPQYDWLKKNASIFGFVESYPQGGKGGFPWEPWHWKYVGRE